MTTHARGYMDVIQHLPVGGALILTDVPWEEYEQLLSDLELSGHNGIRVTYDGGRLEIMSPSLTHEATKELVLLLARLIADELDIDLESCGSTTFKDEGFDKGTEPDTCFYIQNASLIVGKLKIDLRVDPPPDVVVEIDISHESMTKLAIYEAFAVPEVWRYKKRRMEIYQLTPTGYVAVEASITFPFLKADKLSELLQQRETEGQSAVLRSFRNWLRSQPSSRS